MIRLALPLSPPVIAAGVAGLSMACTLPATAMAQESPPSLAPVVVHSTGGSLTAPSTQEAQNAIQQTPGGVALVPDTVWQDSQASTVKDILDYTPGVFAQPKWGEDSRLSIRGSGLSRYYHMRGVALYQDGVPLNNADGSTDFQWIDPTAYRYTEVYKGGNALRYGAGTLGGAINFVTPTGRDADLFQGRVDAGSFGWRRLQTSTGFAGDQSDGFITASTQQQDGFRDHSAGNSLRASGNLGWRLSDRAETRFYLTGVRIRQELPGSLTREQALNDPSMAAAANTANDWRRDIDGYRLSNRTTFVSGNTRYELGGWYAQSTLHHPIYQYLNNDYNDYGAYARLQNSTPLAGHTNRFTLGATWSAGTVDGRNFVNAAGRQGTLLSKTYDSSTNLTLYGENAFDIVPGVSLIAGMQYLHATRERSDRYNGGLPTSRSGEKDYDFLNPKLGVLWQVLPKWQVFANMSRSAEPPTFGDMNFSTANDLDRLQPQRATTFEIGTRGESVDVSWDLALYHSRLANEFQCVSTMWSICDRTSNLDRTVHRGIEAGLHWTMLRGLFTQGAQGGDNLQLSLAYTLSDFRYVNDAQWDNNQIPGVPRHYLRAELLYRHPAGFYAGPNVEWVPQAYYVDNANTVSTAAYALLGLRAGWEHKAYSVFVEGRNLTNRTYIASASITDRARANSALFEPGTGRAIFAGLRITY